MFILHPPNPRNVESLNSCKIEYVKCDRETEEVKRGFLVSKKRKKTSQEKPTQNSKRPAYASITLIASNCEGNANKEIEGIYGNDLFLLRSSSEIF